MSPMAKESEGRKNYFNAKDTGTSAQNKGNAAKNMKKYLPASAFNKTVKSSTTKSLLKFRERQEQKDVKKAQQYKSYQRIMKREGYQINDDKNSRKHLGDASNSTEYNQHEAHKASIIVDALTGESDFAAQSNESVSEPGYDSSNKSMNEQKSTTVNAVTKYKQEDTHAKIEGRKNVLEVKSVDLHGKQMQIEKRNKKRKQHDEEQRRADEYKQRQIQIEREKKEKLKQRKQRHRLLSVRTSKGQPIMKNIALDILNKLQREQQQGEEASTLRHR
jgi:hypothetical protein